MKTNPKGLRPMIATATATTPSGTPWVQTLSGRQWNLLNPDPSALDWDDIASSLALQVRFNGHTVAGRPVTVAVHSLNVMAYLQDRGADAHLALHGLLHDAHEAFIGDIVTPVSAALEILKPGTKKALQRIKAVTDVVIFRAAGLTLSRVIADTLSVKSADAAVYWAERAAHMALCDERWPAGPAPHNDDLALLYDGFMSDFDGGRLHFKQFQARWSADLLATREVTP